jgi:hypothetical protein
MTLEILIQSNYIPTCFNGRLHHQSGQSHLHEPKHCYCQLSTASCTHRFTLCPHQHRCTAILKLPGTMEIQEAGVGICTIAGLYWCVCVCVRARARTCTNEWVYLQEWVHAHVCDCYTDKLHSNMFQWWPSPSSGQSHLHDTKHHYCKLSISSCKHRFTSRPHAYHICTLCPTKLKRPEISYVQLWKWHDVQLST